MHQSVIATSDSLQYASSAWLSLDHAKRQTHVDTFNCSRVVSLTAHLSMMGLGDMLWRSSPKRVTSPAIWMLFQAKRQIKPYRREDTRSYQELLGCNKCVKVT